MQRAGDGQKESRATSLFLGPKLPHQTGRENTAWAGGAGKPFLFYFQTLRLVWNTAGTTVLPQTPIIACRGYKGGWESAFSWESPNSRLTDQKWGVGELAPAIALEPENLLDLRGALESQPHSLEWARQWLSSSDPRHAATRLEPISMEKKSTLLPGTPTLHGRGLELRKWSPWYTPLVQAEYKKSIACTLQNSVLKMTIMWYLFFFLIHFTPMTESRSIHISTNDTVSFLLWLSNIPLYICITSSLSIHLSINI